MQYESRNFNKSGTRGRVREFHPRPKVVPDQRDGVRKGWFSFGIPSRRTNRKWFILCQAMSQNGNQRKRTQQGWCCACDRQIGPLALRFNTQMRTGFFKGDFDIPAHNEPGQDLQWGCRLVRGKKGSGVKLTQGVTNQHPADRQRVSVQGVGAVGSRDGAGLPRLAASQASVR